MLTCDIGNLHFAWSEQKYSIEMYERAEGGGPARRLGFVTNSWEDELVSFSQDTFEEHCQRICEIAANAPIVTEEEDEC